MFSYVATVFQEFFRTSEDNLKVALLHCNIDTTMLITYSNLLMASRQNCLEISYEKQKVHHYIHGIPVFKGLINIIFI